MSCCVVYMVIGTIQLHEYEIFIEEINPEYSPSKPDKISGSGIHMESDKNMENRVFCTLFRNKSSRILKADLDFVNKPVNLGNREHSM